MISIQNEFVIQYPFLDYEARKTPSKNPKERKNKKTTTKNKALISAEGFFSFGFTHLVTNTSL